MLIVLTRISSIQTQCRKMWHPTRRYTAAFYLSMLIVVLSCGASKQNAGLVIILLIIAGCASFWYGMSYVPFGRKAVMQFLRSTICKPCCEAYDSACKGGGGGSASYFSAAGNEV